MLAAVVHDAGNDVGAFHVLYNEALGAVARASTTSGLVNIISKRHSKRYNMTSLIAPSTTLTLTDGDSRLAKES